MGDVPDLMDQSGRAKRLVLALTAAVIVGAAVYGVLYAYAKPDDVATAHAEGISVARHAKTAWRIRVLFLGRRGDRPRSS